MATGFGFPFGVSPAGVIEPDPDENADLSGKIIQVLFTAPGERVNLPDFGCGLFSLVFDANNTVLAAAVEFTVGQALTRWLGDQIAVTSVDVAADGELLTVEVVYQLRSDLTRQSLQIRFS